MKPFEIKDSGQRQAFDTGAVRDTQDGKPRYDLIPPSPLKRTAMRCVGKMKQYDCEKFYAEMFEHVQQFALGDTNDDHMAEIAANALYIMHFQDREELDATIVDHLFGICLVRDTEHNRIRYDLIPPISLYRLAMHYTNGAKKYTLWNWALGMEFSRFYGSMFRHMQQFAMGEQDEDHLAAIVFNAFAIMHFQDTDRDDLNDMYSRIPQKSTNCPMPPVSHNDEGRD